MSGYGQFCPIAKAAELLTERWTLLIIRELVFGSRRYSDLRRGLPRISPTLLAERLRKLEQAGVIERNASDYRLTQAGLELRPLIYILGKWGKRWVNSKFGPEDLDPAFLMWAVRRNLKAEELPWKPAVIYVEFAEKRKRGQRWWLLAGEGDVDLCITDPGHEVDIYVYTDVLTLTRIFEAQLSITEARAARLLTLQGNNDFIRTMDAWLGRPAGRTRALLAAEARRSSEKKLSVERAQDERGARG